MNRVAHGIFEWTDQVPMGAVVFPARSLLMDSGDGWLLWSPLPISEDLKKEIDAIGEVKWILAPNPFHHLFIEPASRLWPEAKLLGPDKLRDSKPQLNWYARPDEVGLGQIEIHRCQASKKFEEFLLFHKPSQTLVVTDLIFHMKEAHNFMTKLVLKFANGISPEVGVPRVSRLLKLMIKDRMALKSALIWMREKSPAMIIPAHGQFLDNGPAERVFQAYRHRFGRDFI